MAADAATIETPIDQALVAGLSAVVTEAGNAFADLDYARALSMLADPRPSGWVKMARLALGKMYRSRRQWAQEQRAASNVHEGERTDAAGRGV